MRAILEKVNPGRDHAFTYHRFHPQHRFDCPFHYHPEIELTLIVQSTGHRFVGDHIGRFGPGDLVLMGPNLPHSYVNDARTERAGSVVLQFLPECLGAGFFSSGRCGSSGRCWSTRAWGWSSTVRCASAWRR
jgi:hypothetical protein